jgi:hypothetical protein
MKIEAGPLPEGQPEMMSAGQCTPERRKRLLTVSSRSSNLFN